LPAAPTLLDLVTVHGPWIVFLLTFVETSFVTGFFVPASVATSIAAGLAVEDGTSVVPVALAALAGGGLGDSVGFWIGRAGRERWASGSGRFAQRVRSAQTRASGYLDGRPFLSVTVARVISFVRTIMPLAAGMSTLSYARFLPYELVGLLVWCAVYIAMGVSAGEGWVLAVRLFDARVVALTVVVIAGVWILVRRRVLRERAGKRSA
jgi:membrane-associated protein